MLSFDASALVKRYREEDHSTWVLDLMDDDTGWFGSMLLAAEVPVALSRSLEATEHLAEVDSRLNRDLDAFHMLPIDSDTIVRAVEIGRAYRLKTLDSIHLAAAQVLPAECQFVTFDERQREVAVALGLKVLQPPV